MRTEKNVSQSRSEPSIADAVPPKKVGRKRDSNRDSEILDAALDVLAEVGFDGMTVDLVAARAKAGKGTLYRRWPSKTELILDAVTFMKKKLVSTDSLPDTGCLRNDLLSLFKPEPSKEVERKLKVMAGITSMLAQHHDLSDSINEIMVEPWEKAYKILMYRAEARGEVSKSANIETVAKVVPSMAAFRSLISRKPFDKDFLLSMVDGVILPALGITHQELQT